MQFVGHTPDSFRLVLRVLDLPDDMRSNLQSNERAKLRHMVKLTSPRSIFERSWRLLHQFRHRKSVGCGEEARLPRVSLEDWSDRR